MPMTKRDVFMALIERSLLDDVTKLDFISFYDAAMTDSASLTEEAIEGEEEESDFVYGEENVPRY